MIARNDYNSRLFNGDVGIALPDADDGGRLKVFFPATGGALPGSRPTMRKFAPARLPDHETVYAMTIHKSQGSEFGGVLIVLPTESSAIMSRELVYTGITRAMRRVEIWGSEQTFREAVQRRARARFCAARAPLERRQLIPGRAALALDGAGAFPTRSF